MLVVVVVIVGVEGVVEAVDGGAGGVRPCGGRRRRARGARGDVAGHEIGHTFNLPHCATPRCMMNDAGGKVKVVDDSTGELCPACREKLGELVTGR